MSYKFLKCLKNSFRDVRDVTALEWLRMSIWEIFGHKLMSLGHIFKELSTITAVYICMTTTKTNGWILNLNPYLFPANFMKFVIRVMLKKPDKIGF